MQLGWFIVIAIFWTGFFVLEGFDFGVGMLHGLVGKTDAEKRVAINTVGPVWDGNEVWLVVAGAGMFAAFPGWYATMFSGFYLAVVLLLVALIFRGISFEFRGKREGTGWRRSWDRAMTASSLLAPLLIGVAFGNLLRGVPIGSNQEYAGNFVDLLNPYALFVGVTFVMLCTLHGATFLALKSDGIVRERANGLARTLAPITVVVVLAFAGWTQSVGGRDLVRAIVPLVAVLAVIGAAVLVRQGREGRAFALTAIGVGAAVATIFVELYPRVMVSSTSAADSLTVTNTSSSPYALKVMTVVALIFFPLVLLYQGWTYHVFRGRVGSPDRGPDAIASGVPTPGDPPGAT
jgi:cytochrome bd ubiquinol oxidase subunit II